MTVSNVHLIEWYGTQHGAIY